MSVRQQPNLNHHYGFCSFVLDLVSIHKTSENWKPLFVEGWVLFMNIELQLYTCTIACPEGSKSIYQDD